MSPFLNIASIQFFFSCFWGQTDTHKINYIVLYIYYTIYYTVKLLKPFIHRYSDKADRPKSSLSFIQPMKEILISCCIINHHHCSFIFLNQLLTSAETQKQTNTQQWECLCNMKRAQRWGTCVCTCISLCLCVCMCVQMCVYLCVQAAQLSQPWGALCGPVIVVLMYFFNIQWNYGNRTTGDSEERKRKKEREREEVEEEKGSPLSH